MPDFKHSNLRDAASPMHFVPQRQSNSTPRVMTFYVRTSLNADETIMAIRRVMRGLDQNLPIEALHDRAV